MELLLLVIDGNRYALDMIHVARIVKMKDLDMPPERFLAADNGQEKAVLLRSDFVLPVDSIEKVFSCNQCAVTPNPFLLGCMTSDKIDAFVLVNQDVFGLLSPVFLRLDAGAAGD